MRYGIAEENVMLSKYSTPYKIVWIALCLMVLIASLFVSDPDNEHSLLFLYIPMIILSFPSGLIVPVIIGSVAYLIFHLGIHNPFGMERFWNAWFYAMYIAYWLTFLAVGYIQWFILVPYLKARFG
jgi:hypothetical protein